MELLNRKILLVDDEDSILELLEGVFRDAGFKNLEFAKSKREALVMWEEFEPELLVLDIMLPDGDGYEVLETIRRKSNVPVLFLSALSDIEKQYKGFDLGGDDYMVKPFLPRELILRVKAILKRTYPETEDVVGLHSRVIDFERAVVIAGDEEVQLTAKEYKILRLLYDNANKIVTIDGILSGVWGEDYYGYENSLMAHIRKIREKIEENPSEPVNLITVKGLGYKLVVN